MLTELRSCGRGVMTYTGRRLFYESLFTFFIYVFILPKLLFVEMFVPFYIFFLSKIKKIILLTRPCMTLENAKEGFLCDILLDFTDHA